MYLDKHRQSKKDKTQNCTDPACQFFENTGNPAPVHRYGSKGCSHYEEYQLRLVFEPRPKHSPLKPEKALEAPF
jgi:hypothetical protein